MSRKIKGVKIDPFGLIMANSPHKKSKPLEFGRY